MAEKNHDSWYTILGINPALLSLSLEVRSYWWRKLWVIITHAQVCSFLRSLRGWKIAFSLPFFPPLPHLLVCGSSWSRSCHFGRMKSEVLLARHCRLMFAGFFFQTRITLSSSRKRAENKRANERTPDLEIERENEAQRVEERLRLRLGLRLQIRKMISMLLPRRRTFNRFYLRRKGRKVGSSTSM